MAFGKFAQYTPSEIAYNPVHFDVVAALHKLFQEAEKLDAGKHKMVFSSDVPRREILNDPEHLKLILMNLLQNATKYSDPGTTITVELKAAGDQISFSVTDEGIGIPQAELDKLYSPFFRGSNTSSKPGTGLGLSILKRSAKFAGASIQVDSEINAGTRFVIGLPAAKMVQ